MCDIFVIVVVSYLFLHLIDPVRHISWQIHKEDQAKNQFKQHQIKTKMREDTNLN